MNQMVDNLVGPEPSNNTVLPPPTPPAPTLTSAQGDGANETSYGVGNSTLTALDFVNQVRSWSPKVQPPEAPNPTLPSIMNSPFAPRPEEEPLLTRSPATRRMTPRIRRSSHNSDFRNIAWIQRLVACQSPPYRLPWLPSHLYTRH